MPGTITEAKLCQISVSIPAMKTWYFLLSFTNGRCEINGHKKYV
jgi:hypothetical protein